MGKYDKDRFQKELAIRYCLARGVVPFLEVIVPSSSDLSDSVEVLTDLDVVGIESSNDGQQIRVLFDCKTSAKMSAINRAFWAAGVRDYVKFERAVVILKNQPLTNHRLSALALGIDLHNETSFKDLGATYDAAFPADSYYQSSISGWEKVAECYDKYAWSKATFDVVRNLVPLSNAPATTFRRLIAVLRESKGQYDPAKSEHMAIFLDVLSSCMVLWASLSRDIRRFYDPTMEKADFERILRYYVWGGKESYQIRQKLRENSKVDLAENAELPAWKLLVDFSGLSVSAPTGSLGGAHLFRELSIRSVTSKRDAFDEKIRERFASDNRLRQFAIGMTNYLVAAGGLPADMGKNTHALLTAF